jgi:hypothetical protein
VPAAITGPVWPLGPLRAPAITDFARDTPDRLRLPTHLHRGDQLHEHYGACVADAGALGAEGGRSRPGQLHDAPQLLVDGKAARPCQGRVRLVRPRLGRVERVPDSGGGRAGAWAGGDGPAENEVQATSTHLQAPVASHRGDRREGHWKRGDAARLVSLWPAGARDCGIRVYLQEGDDPDARRGGPVRHVEHRGRGGQQSLDRSGLWGTTCTAAWLLAGGGVPTIQGVGDDPAGGASRLVEQRPVQWLAGAWLFCELRCEA